VTSRTTSVVSSAFSANGVRVVAHATRRDRRWSLTERIGRIGGLCCDEFVSGQTEDRVDTESEEVLSAPTDPEKLAQLVHSRPWFHTIDLGNGIVTPGEDNTPARVDMMGFPESVAGKSVLDIGS
jgi:hypothetical protein